MTNEIDKKLMLKFLERNYPVSRVKFNLRFKRAIILDSGGVCILGNSVDLGNVRFELINTLIKVFSCDEATSRVVLDNFLKLT